MTEFTEGAHVHVSYTAILADIEALASEDDPDGWVNVTLPDGTTLGAPYSALRAVGADGACNDALEWLEAAADAALLRHSRAIGRLHAAQILLEQRGIDWDRQNVARSHALCEAANRNVRAAQAAWSLLLGRLEARQ